MCRIYSKLLSSVMECREHLDKVTKHLPELERSCGLHFDRNKNIKNQLLHAITAVSSRYNDTDAPYITHLDYHVAHRHYLHKEWYHDVLWLPFENVTIPAPAAYDAVLTALYGANYMTPKIQPSHEYPFYQKQYRMLAEALVAGRMVESLAPDIF